MSTMINFQDYGRSVSMMSTVQWLQRATEQINDPERRAIIMSFPTSRAQTEAALTFVAAESIPSERQSTYWNLGTGNVLYLFEKSLQDGTDPVDEFKRAEAAKKGFYRTTGLGR